MMLDDEFLGVAASWHLPRFVAQSWDALTDHQREQFAAILPTAFDKFADTNGAFAVASSSVGSRFIKVLAAPSSESPLNQILFITKGSGLRTTDASALGPPKIAGARIGFLGR